MNGPTPGYAGRFARAVPGGIDLGVLLGLALYSLLEFGSTGSFGWQRSNYATPEETKAATLLGIGAGLVDVGWYFLRPFGRLFPPTPLGWERSESEALDAQALDPIGLDGKEPSPRSLGFLVFGELGTYFMAALIILTLAGLVAIAVVRYIPQAFPLLIPASVLGFGVYLWSRLSRLQRLRRTGAEVEGRLVGVDSGDEGEKIAKYEYTFRGKTGHVSNAAWLGRRVALRHGERIVVLLDQRHPDDAVILGSYPSGVVK